VKKLPKYQQTSVETKKKFFCPTNCSFFFSPGFKTFQVKSVPYGSKPNNPIFQKFRIDQLQSYVIFWFFIQINSAVKKNPSFFSKIGEGG
jgi:hypothetical protein